jgi:hypothetical protein
MGILDQQIKFYEVIGQKHTSISNFEIQKKYIFQRRGCTFEWKPLEILDQQNVFHSYRRKNAIILNFDIRVFEL